MLISPSSISFDICFIIFLIVFAFINILYLLFEIYFSGYALRSNIKLYGDRNYPVELIDTAVRNSIVSVVGHTFLIVCIILFLTELFKDRKPKEIVKLEENIKARIEIIKENIYKKRISNRNKKAKKLKEKYEKKLNQLESND